MDCLVSNEGWTIDDLPKGAVVGTGSPRRKSQLLHIRPDLVIRDIRGNVDTRLAKLHRGEYQAIVLAYAGLHRLELDASKSPRLSLDCMLPAVGQGALGIETREGDNEAFEALSLINHRESEICVRCERELLRLLHAGCLAPVAAHAILEGNTLTIRARVLSADGAMLLAVNVRESQDATGSSGDRTPERLARFAAEKLLAQGADRLIGSERSGNLGTPVFP